MIITQYTDTMKQLAIRRIELLYNNRPKQRKVKVTLTNGTRIYIERCYESWQQYGGTRSELYLTMPLAEKYNAWLHGEPEPSDY